MGRVNIHQYRASFQRLADGLIGTRDFPCPMCGPTRRKPASQRKPVLRIWASQSGLAGFYCARCGERGYVRNGLVTSRLDPTTLDRLKAEAAQRDRIATADRLQTARWLWRQRQPILGSIAETHLRQARGYHGPLPATLGFLPARGGHEPAMIAAFGLPSEPEPGRIVIADDAVCGVHITRLAPDGLEKAGTDTDKKMIGKSVGWPIVLAPANDLLGLAITEGIENALSVHEATGLGAWAAGAASRLPGLAEAVPEHINSVTVFLDNDEDGRRYGHELATRLRKRGFDVRLVLPRAASRRTAA
jgi:predicted RNA-binding Zn-ribbon protein involved in translation (DUF1610 family)